MAPRAPREAPKTPAEIEKAYWGPPTWDAADITACQALERGEANKDQQKRFVRWLHAACRTHGMTFAPTSERASCFAEGRRHVGRWFINLCQLNAAAFIKDKDNVSEKG